MSVIQVSNPYLGMGVKKKKKKKEKKQWSKIWRRGVIDLWRERKSQSKKESLW